MRGAVGLGGRHVTQVRPFDGLMHGRPAPMTGSRRAPGPA